MADRTCSVPGCDKPPRTAKAEWCPMHYHRWYRHGDVDKTAHGAHTKAGSGRQYISHNAPSHPLATPSGKVYEHRMVLFDVIGYGPHLCHWCDATVHWLPRGVPGCLNVDHLNGVTNDNRPANLVPSCVGCNTARGQQARSAALRQDGWWSQNDTIAALRSGGRRAPIDA